MKKITIELPEGYDDVISITAIGSSCVGVTNVSTMAFDLNKGTHITYDSQNWNQTEEIGE